MSLKPVIGTILVSAAVIGLSAIPGVQAQQEYVPKAAVKPLHQAPLPGMEGKEMIVKHFSLPPGFVGGRHFHPGPVFVYVLEGELTVETENGTETFEAGQLYPEPLSVKMRGRNLSTEDDLEILVFQVGDIGKPMMIKVEE